MSMPSSQPSGDGHSCLPKILKARIARRFPEDPSPICVSEKGHNINICLMSLMHLRYITQRTLYDMHYIRAYSILYMACSLGTRNDEKL